MSQILSTTTDIHSVTHNVNVNTNTIQNNGMSVGQTNCEPTLQHISTMTSSRTNTCIQIHIRWTYSTSMFYVSTENGGTLTCKHKLHVIVFLQSTPDKVESETNCYVINHLIWHSYVFYCFVWNMFDPMITIQPRPILLKCLYQSRKMNCHVYVY